MARLGIVGVKFEVGLLALRARNQIGRLEGFFVCRVVILRVKAELDRRGRLHSGAELEGGWSQV